MENKLTHFRHILQSANKYRVNNEEAHVCYADIIEEVLNYFEYQTSTEYRFNYSDWPNGEGGFGVFSWIDDDNHLHTYGVDYIYKKEEN